MDLKTDEELYFEWFKRENVQAFHQIYERHASSLFRFIYRFTLNRPAAEDLLQDIFTDLHAGKFTVTEVGTLKSWLYTIAKNKSLNFIRKNSFETPQESFIQTALVEENLESQVISQNLLDRLTNLEKQLPADLAQTWNLRKAGMDYQQIAGELSIPLGTVKSRFSRLVEYLTKHF